jgi:ssDNA-binding Zn-finger/Zn-ribbon topoisomerase 1
MGKNNDGARELDLSKLACTNIQCADCEKTLLRMLKMEESDFEFSVTCTCPFCGGSSWRVELQGRYYQDVVDGTRLGEVIVEENDFTIEVKKTND